METTDNKATETNVQEKPVYSFEDFRKSFWAVGQIRIDKKNIPKLVLFRAYTVRDIIITNGAASIWIIESDSLQSTIPTLSVFDLSYEMTQLNLPYLGENLRGENFQIEAVGGDFTQAQIVPDGKYILQVGRKNLKFQE